ncbi:R-SNARE 3 [Giardia duodenalis]|uniref:R-SNARE 3 n=2 Tax=Giardia intestinalis TaxID=5741 RepID=A8BKZ4_GIAIC|nr:R-SNARE 3 [Giardia intestinalis]KAE8301600.1 R-SNARE 3 [Giardia intestinalis]|eukprot:XP_001706385.1 Synaptobrevin-like protein [Giardia lamblia ATCC 50803]
MSAGNIYALYAYRQRDYRLLGSAIYVDAKRQEVSLSVSKLVDSFREKNTALTVANSRLCIKTKDGFSLHLLYREFAVVGVPLGIVFIAAARETHRTTLVNSFLNDITSDLDGNMTAIKLADSRDEPDTLSRALLSASQLPLKKYDQVAGDMLGQIQSDMASIRDNAARNIDKLRVNTDTLNTIEQNAGQLATSADAFKSEAKRVEKAAKCRKIKMYAIIAAIILVILLIIIVPIAIKFS